MKSTSRLYIRVLEEVLYREGCIESTVSLRNPMDNSWSPFFTNSQLKRMLELNMLKADFHTLCYAQASFPILIHLARSFIKCYN